MSGSIRKTLVALAGLALSFGAGVASADTISFDLGNPNTAISGYTGPYANVTVDLTSTTTATITFTALTNGIYTYVLVDGSSAAVNVNASTWTLSGLTGTPFFGNGPSLTDVGTQQSDGFGNFNQAID